MRYSNIINQHTRRDCRDIVMSNLVNWQNFKDKTILITGSTGFIGVQTVLALSKASKDYNLNVKLILPVRNIKKAKSIFYSELRFVNIKLIKQDINKKINYHGKIDFIIHAASNTSSKSFVDTPVETIDTTVNGTMNILELAKEKQVKSVVYLSSMEVYGTVNSDVPLKEDDYGYLDLINERNSYPQAKRLAETMCYSYFKEYNLPVKIARLCQIIGANIPYNDTRVFAQFARNVVEKKDIVLHTDGSTVRNYCYITDCITAIFKILTEGASGEAYNVANKDAICSIKEMAEKITKDTPEIKVIVENKNSNLYPKNCKIFLDTNKLESLGWNAEIAVDDILSKLVDGFLAQKNQSLMQFTFKDYLKDYICFKNFGGHKNLSILGLKFRIPNNFIYEHIYKYLPVDNKKIVFDNFSGIGYGCNPRYIADELLKQKVNCKINWLVQNPKENKKNFPKNIKLIDITSEKAIYELSTAKLWIGNTHKSNLLKRGLTKKIAKQIYIQTWHGSLGIKKINNDANPEFWKNSSLCELYKKDSSMIDIMISNSSFETNVYKSAISDKAEIKEYGHPRNDIFFKDNKGLKDKICQQYNINTNSNILLYVPTFRDNNHISCYNIEYEKLFAPLKEKFGGDWKIFIRLHPRLKHLTNLLIPQSDSIIDVTMYQDIQELLASADIAITDYSSCIFDFMLTKKPGFIYATDIEEYNTERGFYYPLEETPFPIARNNEELIQNILNFDNEKYQQKVEKFLKDKGCIEDGHASERVVELIKKYIN